MYLKYLKYILKHRWYVMVECFKEGLYWRGIMHDLSKFSLDELIPYANYFYGNKKNCHNCQHIIENGSQCDINWAGIGDGKQGKDCADYKEQGIKKGRNSTGYYKPYDTGDNKFDFAWLLHQKRNKHHWQWWILPTDEEGIKIFEIPEPYLTEMICDWVGAGKAQGHFSPKNDKYFETRKWYCENKNKMQLNKNTRKKIEDRLLCKN